MIQVSSKLKWKPMHSLYSLAQGPSASSLNQRVTWLLVTYFKDSLLWDIQLLLTFFSLLNWLLNSFARHAKGGKHPRHSVNEARPLSVFSQTIRGRVAMRPGWDRCTDGPILCCCCWRYQHHAGPSKHPPMGSTPSWFTTEGVFSINIAGFK